MATDVCAIGKVDDGTLRVCCSTHQHVLCAHHYAVTHFVETMPAHAPENACDAGPATAPVLPIRPDAT